MKLILKTAILVLIFTRPGFGQGLIDLESNYFSTLAILKQQQTKLDSLNADLEISAAQIDAEKNRTDTDEGKLRKRLALALDLSNEIEEQQTVIIEIKIMLADRRYSLIERYSEIIDSLNIDKKSAQNSHEKQELQNRSGLLTQKRIMISPVVESFSFDAQRIQSIQLDKATDDLEREILADYLQNALVEVSGKLGSLKQTKTELEGIVLLQEKTDDFLEEVDTEGIVGFLPSTNVTLSAGRNASALEQEAAFSSKDNSITTQIQAFLSLASQLNFEGKSLPTKTGASELGIENRNVTFREYLRLLDQVEVQLVKYRAVLTNKLGITE